MGLAPTTSSTMMLALGDALAVALMERRGFGPDQYKRLHPGGALGRMLLKVKDIMHAGAELPLAREGDPMPEAVRRISEGRFGCVGVVGADGALIGIITDGDLRRRFGEPLADRTAGEVMTRDPRTVGVEALASEALALMNRADRPVTALFVVDPASRAPVGLLHIHDCLKAGFT